MDFATARRKMVDNQVRPNGVTDPGIVAAMLEVPRERFVPADKAAMAYMDSDLVVSPGGPGRRGRALLKPMVLARLIQAAGVTAADRVLDVACGTGYSSAVLARLAQSVTALEEAADLAREAAASLKELGTENVTTVVGAIEAGWPAGAPYDAILVNGAVEIDPEALLGQLKEGGRLVAVVGSGPNGKAMLYQRVAGEISARPVFDAAAPVLAGFVRPPAFVF
jgi:protein-L-isoaspartate(D-aspartate) O-methyltransferase